MFKHYFSFLIFFGTISTLSTMSVIASDISVDVGLDISKIKEKFRRPGSALNPQPVNEINPDANNDISHSPMFAVGFYSWMLKGKLKVIRIRGSQQIEKANKLKTAFSQLKSSKGGVIDFSGVLPDEDLKNLNTKMSFTLLDLKCFKDFFAKNKIAFVLLCENEKWSVQNIYRYGDDFYVIDAQSGVITPFLQLNVDRFSAIFLGTPYEDEKPNEIKSSLSKKAVLDEASEKALLFEIKYGLEQGVAFQEELLRQDPHNSKAIDKLIVLAKEIRKIKGWEMKAFSLIKKIAFEVQSAEAMVLAAVWAVEDAKVCIEQAKSTNYKPHLVNALSNALGAFDAAFQTQQEDMEIESVASKTSSAQPALPLEDLLIQRLQAIEQKNSQLDKENIARED